MAGVGDVGEGLCAANMPYGLAKIQHVQAELGLPPDASFIGAPDATVTRNTVRWDHGFGYGGRVQWSGDFAVLDIKSNHCGMIAVSLDEAPPPAEIEARARKLMADAMVIDGVEVDFDLAEGNHFLDVCEVRNPEPGTPRKLAVIHSSGHEFREVSPKGPGIYWDQSPSLSAMMETRETPWGPLHILRGDRADEWYAAYTWCQEFSLRRREALARALLGPVEVVVNRTHQGLSAKNDAILGCYTFDAEDLARKQLFPLTLSPELPVYLVAPRPNMDDAALDATGFGERAERLGISERLRNAQLLPHGGGYSYAQYARVRGVEERDGDRWFVLEKSDGSADTVHDVRAAAYGYRGDEVRQRMLELQAGRAGGHHGYPLHLCDCESLTSAAGAAAAVAAGAAGAAVRRVRSASPRTCRRFRHPRRHTGWCRWRSHRRRPCIRCRVRTCFHTRRSWPGSSGCSRTLRVCRTRSPPRRTRRRRRHNDARRCRPHRTRRSSGCPSARPRRRCCSRSLPCRSSPCSYLRSTLRRPCTLGHSRHSWPGYCRCRRKRRRTGWCRPGTSRSPCCTPGRPCTRCRRRRNSWGPH